MKKWIFVMAMLSAPFLVTAQATDQNATDQQEEPAFVMVETMPEYPGGNEALAKYIGDNLKYPESALEAKVEGTVYISFIVNTDGSVSDVKVLRGIQSDCDAEAMRVVGTLTNWEPGKQSGKNVRVVFNLPIKFKLS